MALGNISNTVLAAIPKGMGLTSAWASFSKFGEIYDLQPLSGPAVAVSYFDVRAAALAKERLGGEKYCRPGPPVGDRTVRLHGETVLKREDFAGVSNMIQHDSEEYTAEFFDLRDAERVRKLAASPQDIDVIKPPPGLEHLEASSPKAKVPVPAYAAIRQTPTPVRRGRAPSATTQQTIKIQGMPSALASEACVEAMLQQAGLYSSVLHFSTKSNGEVFITLSDAAAAQHCLAHFQGCCWGSARGAVVACMVDEAAAHIPAARKRGETIDTTASTDVGSEEDSEVAVACA